MVPEAGAGQVFWQSASMLQVLTQLFDPELVEELVLVVPVPELVLGLPPPEVELDVVGALPTPALVEV